MYPNGVQIKNESILIILYVPTSSPGPAKGSFIQYLFHGNPGYIGLTPAFYHLDDSGSVKAAIIAGFVMILQNTLWPHKGRNR
jgi:hypothetical protein